MSKHADIKLLAELHDMQLDKPDPLITKKICVLRQAFRQGSTVKAVFWLGINGYYGFSVNISYVRFKQSRISMLIPHIMMFWAVL